MKKVFENQFLLLRNEVNANENEKREKSDEENKKEYNVQKLPFKLN
jgi:hypothetical protein